MTKQTLREKQTILGNDDSAGIGALKRQAPESSGLLKELDSAITRKPKQDREAKKRQILERCGCL